MRRQFQNWYGEMICKQLENKIEEEVDMHLSIMKPLSARWLIDMHKYFVDHPSIIVNGFHRAGIVNDILGLHPIMLLKLPIMLCSNTPEFYPLCSNYSP